MTWNTVIGMTLCCLRCAGACMHARHLRRFAATYVHTYVPGDVIMLISTRIYMPTRAMPGCTFRFSSVSSFLFTLMRTICADRECP